MIEDNRAAEKNQQLRIYKKKRSLIHLYAYHHGHEVLKTQYTTQQHKSQVRGVARTQQELSGMGTEGAGRRRQPEFKRH